MGARGPAPKPHALREMEGNPAKRPLNKAAPRGRGRPSLPEHLGEYGRDVWERIRGSMPPAIYAACDTEALAAYCHAAEMHREAVLMIREQGAVVPDRFGAPQPNAWVTILNRQAELIAKLGSRLGLDPAARSGLMLPLDDGEAPGKFGGLIAIKGGRGGSSSSSSD